MAVSLSRAMLAISFDLPPDNGAALADRRDRIVPRLLAMLAAVRVPATWAAADPARLPAARQIASEPSGHALAILGDASWVGRHAGRHPFASELRRRIADARERGLTVATLALPSALLDDHWDVAARHDIKVVRQSGAAGRSPAPQGPARLRFGLWNLPTTFWLPGTSRWVAGGGGLRGARQGIDRAIEARGVFHLSIDVARLGQPGRAAERVLERLVMHVDGRRRQGILDVVTLVEAARRLDSRYARQPSCSILRPAA